ncbi:ATP-binding protein [Coprococcus catus]|uniref:ATP-binding protein n=1 Tax=Coprococcus catus TaxID=116085 RepID=UPI003D042649
MAEKYAKHFQQILLIGIFIIIGAQINMNLFIDNFRISIGTLIFPITFVMFGKYPVLPVTFISAVGVLTSRVLSEWLRYDQIQFYSFFPEMIFYLVYGTLFYIYSHKKETLSPDCAAVLFIFDYISNLTELLVRLGAGAFNIKSQFGILLVAFSRSLIIYGILFCLHHYKFSLLRREHALRYQRLLLLISKLNGEVVWMKKNTGLIEETMNTSYQLYRELEENGTDETLSRKALGVAKDIHEIKKEYLLILRGLSEALDLNLKDEGMYLTDILTVLKQSLTTESSDKKADISFLIQENLYTENHYFLMSVFRNLLTNAIEASEKDNPQIHVIQSTDADSYLFDVTDDGPGILPEDLEQIFSPGFSTKINFTTGEISRGLGLNLVQDLIKNQWNGEIQVSSVPGCTTFHIRIPKSDWR